MSLDCVVVTPEREAFKGTVTQAILPAHDGLIGIQTSRAPLLTQLGVGPLRLDVVGGGSVFFLIDSGVAQMKDNVLTILTSSCTPANEIDAEKARQDMLEAQARKPVDEVAMEQKHHDVEKARAAQKLAAQH